MKISCVVSRLFLVAAVCVGGPQRRGNAATLWCCRAAAGRPVYCELQREVGMSFDDLLIAIIFAGIGLSAAYFRAEYVTWRRYMAAARRKAVRLRELR